MENVPRGPAMSLGHFAVEATKIGVDATLAMWKLSRKFWQSSG